FYSLLTAHCSLLTAHCSLLTAHCSLLTAHYSLLTTHSASAPHLFGELHDHAQLRPLLLLGQEIALLGRGEAALRRERELIDIDVFRRLLDPPLELIAALELAGLGGDEPEHDGLALWHEPQRLEPAGARAVVFHEI